MVREVEYHKFVPFAKTTSKRKTHLMSKEARKLINTRERLFRNYCTTRRDIDFQKYKNLRNKVNASVRKDKLNDTRKKCELFRQIRKLSMDM